MYYFPLQHTSFKVHVLFLTFLCHLPPQRKVSDLQTDNLHDLEDYELDLRELGTPAGSDPPLSLLLSPLGTNGTRRAVATSEVDTSSKAVVADPVREGTSTVEETVPAPAPHSAASSRRRSFQQVGHLREKPKEKLDKLVATTAHHPPPPPLVTSMEGIHICICICICISIYIYMYTFAYIYIYIPILLGRKDIPSFSSIPPFFQSSSNLPFNLPSFLPFCLPSYPPSFQLLFLLTFLPSFHIWDKTSSMKLRTK